MNLIHDIMNSICDITNLIHDITKSIRDYVHIKNSNYTYREFRIK